jgi:hypothetical protein
MGPAHHWLLGGRFSALCTISDLDYGPVMPNLSSNYGKTHQDGFIYRGIRSFFWMLLRLELQSSIKYSLQNNIHTVQ